jgi:hypothetical protein
MKTKTNLPMFYDCQFSENIAGDDLTPAVPVEFTGERPIGFNGLIRKGQKGVIAASKEHKNNPMFPSGIAYMVKLPNDIYFGWSDSKPWKKVTE